MNTTEISFCYQQPVENAILVSVFSKGQKEDTSAFPIKFVFFTVFFIDHLTFGAVNKKI